jgi:hypothetical protein
MKKYIITVLIIAVGLIIAQEMSVDGKLTVTDEIDLTGNRITNVGDPVEDTDGVNALYVESRVANQNNIIELKCAWESYDLYSTHPQGAGSCTPPDCPEGWTELAMSNEVSAVGLASGGYWLELGNTIRICQESE